MKKYGTFILGLVTTGLIFATLKPVEILLMAVIFAVFFVCLFTMTYKEPFWKIKD